MASLKLFVFLIFPTLLLAEVYSLTTPVAATRSVTQNGGKEIRINLHPEVLRQGSIIAVDLPEGARAVFRNTGFKKRALDDFSWTGQAAEHNASDAILLTTKNGVTYGTIRHAGQKYILQMVPGEGYTVFAAPKRSVSHDDFLIAPQPVGLDPGLPESNTTSAGPAPVPRQAVSRAVEANSTVDVLVLYTQQYADHYGSGLDAKIQNSIDFANTSMGDSGVAMSYRLIHQELYDHDDSNENADIYDALCRISGVDCSTYQRDLSINADVRRIRADHDADLVTLFRLNLSGGTVGLGWVPQENSKDALRKTSYNVSEFDDITFAHESGHNLGCGHSRDIDDCAGALFDYACGFDGGSFGTVMSYNSNIIQYFSTPNESYDGTTIGDADTDCARGIGETRTSMETVSDVTEPLEAGDAYADGQIAGQLDPEGDRDSYSVELGGSTTLTLDSEYSSPAFFLNLYDSRGFLIGSYEDSSVTLTLPDDRYILVISTKNDTSDTYYTGTRNYTVGIATEYTPDAVKIQPAIHYLLF